MLIALASAILVQEPASLPDPVGVDRAAAYSWTERPADNLAACRRMMAAAGFVGQRAMLSGQTAAGLNERIGASAARYNETQSEAAAFEVEAYTALRDLDRERREDAAVATETLMNAATYFCPTIIDELVAE